MPISVQIILLVGWLVFCQNVSLFSAWPWLVLLEERNFLTISPILTSQSSVLCGNCPAGAPVIQTGHDRVDWTDRRSKSWLVLSHRALSLSQSGWQWSHLMLQNPNTTSHLSSASPQPFINSIHYSQDLARRARDVEITHSECLTQYIQHF